MFQNKTVVVTGSGRGIGRTLATGFAAQGARVLVHYAHSEHEAKDVVTQIIASGGQANLVQADLSKPEEVTRFVKEAYDLYGHIDVWVNNAGASANSKETRGLSEVEIFERVMDVDVLGTWRCCREIEPYMHNGGCILTTGWDGALSGISGFSGQVYAMSKGAIISLTRCLAVEYAPRIRVNCIAPGFIENEWSQSLPINSRQNITQQIPLQRWGMAEDVLGAALFLASPAAAFITGQVLLVNGGMVMR
ncbi:MAG: SDR family oxidoreductase [Ktedonobacteraceae bacterium]|nr:SDR family oxidoreductase [Ktedonobacteraceae bacterium]